MVTFHDYVNGIHLEGDSDSLKLSPIFVISSSEEYQYELDYFVDNMKRLIGYNLCHNGINYQYSAKHWEVMFDVNKANKFEMIVMEPK